VDNDTGQAVRAWAALQALYDIRRTLSTGRVSGDLLDNLTDCLHELTTAIGLFYLQQKIIRAFGIDGAQEKMDALLARIKQVDIRKLQRWLDSNS